MKGWEPPETYVAWREEVGLIRDALVERYPPSELLGDYPLKPHELLRDRSDRVLKHLKKLAERALAQEGSKPFVWRLDVDNVTVVPLDEVKNWEVADIAAKTVILAPALGGLTATGQLDGDAEPSETLRYDVADEWRGENGEPQRARVWDAGPPPGMRLVVRIDTALSDDETDEEGVGTESRRYWCFCVLPRAVDDDGSRSARLTQTLDRHLELAGQFAAAIAAKLGLGEERGADLAGAITLAAKWHDLGKRRAVWQRSIGNVDYPARVLAKPGGFMRPLDLTGYRHELGSIVDVSVSEELRGLSPATQDLLLHAIAAHHGRARPWFPDKEVFDPERPQDAVEAAAVEVPRRFGRLQRAYGRWGLAYLESLMRAADVLASQAQADAEGGAR
jgi:CRISPR-associated endonuclease/helicase Cas3